MSREKMRNMPKTWTTFKRAMHSGMGTYNGLSSIMCRLNIHHKENHDNSILYLPKWVVVAFVIDESSDRVINNIRKSPRRRAELTKRYDNE